MAYPKPLVLLVLSLGLTLSGSAPTMAEDEDTPWYRSTEGDLERGRAVVERERDQFVGQILIPADPEAVWNVLTDYEQFSEFMPGVVETEITPVAGLEQSLIMRTESVTSVLFSKISSTVTLSLQERPQTLIEFDLVDSDSLTSLSGMWSLELNPDSNHSLLTYEAQASTNAAPSGIFAGVFSRQIRENLTAIRDEVIRRQS